MPNHENKSIFMRALRALKARYDNFINSKPKISDSEKEKQQHLEPLEQKVEKKEELESTYTLYLNKVESFPITIDNERQNNIELSTMPDSFNAPSLVKISYITDLHLLHKLKENGINDKESISGVIKAIVDSIVNESDEILLIGGDVASDFNIFELFIKQLNIRINRDYFTRVKYVFFVLGNHEYWDFPQLKVNEIVAKYKELTRKYCMYILHNEIAYINNGYLTYDNIYVKKQLCFISSEELNNLENTELRQRLRMASFIIFGGTGFSGYSNEFNANNGIYRKTINREQEIEECNKFNVIYKKICNALPNRKIVVLTHTPMNCWSEKSYYQSNYIYVSGHTHKNYRYDDGEIRIYSDNQIGYHNNSPHVKWFYYDRRVDYFSDYKDGIYKITRFEYLHFYRCNNVWPKFNKKFDVLYILKKKGYYCFIISRKNKLLILNGGKDYNLPRNDINYFYNNMDLVIENIQDPLNDYTAIQKSISHEVQMFGGDGRIHGCIVDIDFYNHIYVNPVDHKITAYYALDMTDKWVYSSVAGLLKDNNQDMYNRLNALINDNKNMLPCMYSKGIEEKSPQQYLEKDIYAASRELCKLQKLHSNILTVWRNPRSKKGNLLLE